MKVAGRVSLRGTARLIVNLGSGALGPLWRWRAIEVPVPRTALEWDAETDVLRLAKCYRGREWFPRLRLFAVAACRRIWDQLPAGDCHKAVEVAERFALGDATKRELHAASANAFAAVRATQRVRDTGWFYGTLADAEASAAWACTLPAEHPAQEAPRHVLRAVSLLRYQEEVRGGASHRQAEEAARGVLAVEQAALVTLLRELVGNPFL
jgi:hypothetical protein